MFSKRTFSAVEATVIIASQPQGMTVSTQDLALSLGLSISYLEGILKTLKTSGIIRSYRGPGGGYQINADVHQLSIWDVVSLFEGSPEVTQEPESEAMRSESSESYFSGLFELAKNYLAEQKLAAWVDLGRLPKHERANDLQGRFKLKPLPEVSLPKVPNSVFQLPTYGIPVSRVA